MLKNFILIKIFLLNCLGSDIHQFGLKKNFGKFEISKEKGLLVSKLFWKNRTLTKFNKSAATEPLKRYSNIYLKDKLYVVYGFQKGAHGEFVEVWSFPKAKKVWSFNSIWPIEISQTKNKLEIKYYDESNSPIKNKGKLINFR